MTEIEAFIRQVAPYYGIDPDIAVRVAASEGGLNDPFRQGESTLRYGREESYGPFQLHMRWGGVGERALKERGIDPRKDWKRGVEYALEEASKRGWGQWFGAAKAGIGNYAGIGGKRQPRLKTEDVQGPISIRHPPNPTVGTDNYGRPVEGNTGVRVSHPPNSTLTGEEIDTLKEGLPGAETVADEKATPDYGDIAANLGALAGGGGKNLYKLPKSTIPRMANVTQGQWIDPIIPQAPRDALTMAMMRLNSGKLWG